MLIIRDFQAGDRAAYLAMSRDFYAGPATLHPVDEANFAATFDAALARSPFLRALALECEGALVGYMLLSFTWSNEVGGLCVLLEEIYIKQEARGAHLGSQCITWLLDTYRARAKRFRLEVSPDNGAVAGLYARFGFAPLTYGQMVLDV